jgi:hypothetical protein
MTSANIANLAAENVVRPYELSTIADSSSLVSALMAFSASAFTFSSGRR